jgi:hypothetical protein
MKIALILFTTLINFQVYAGIECSIDIYKNDKLVSEQVIKDFKENDFYYKDVFSSDGKKFQLSVDADYTGENPIQWTQLTSIVLSNGNKPIGSAGRQSRLNNPEECDKWLSLGASFENFYFDIYCKVH